MTKVLWRTIALAGCIATFIGCGPDIRDPSRVPAGAVDTSDPSKVNMGAPAPGAPAGAKMGPPGGAPAAPPGS